MNADFYGPFFTFSKLSFVIFACTSAYECSRESAGRGDL
jgi:hypothetical protein